MPLNVSLIEFRIAVRLESQSTNTYGISKDFKLSLSHDVASGSEMSPCNKIEKLLVVYRFSGNVMTSITTLRT